MTSDTRPVIGGASPVPAGESSGLRDAEARRAAVDPTRNVVLEASAGTGKTRVLVDRYVNLIRAVSIPGTSWR